MKTLLIAGAIMAFGAAAVQAQNLTCDTFGTMQKCRGPNGYTSTQDTFGTMTEGGRPGPIAARSRARGGIPKKGTASRSRAQGWSRVGGCKFCEW
jgi:hypothetical protein